METLKTYRVLFTFCDSLHGIYKEFTNSETYLDFLSALIASREVDNVVILSGKGKKFLKKGIAKLCPFLEAGQGPFAPKMS